MVSVFSASWRRYHWLILLTAAQFFILWLILPMRHYQPAMHFVQKEAAIAKTLAAQKIIGNRIIGPEYTWITTTLGALEAKRLSTHPDFAAVITGWLADAGFKPGDAVAVNMSGSFPALNIAALAAIDSLRLRPVIVSSAGASTWGATDPEFTWLDMESALVAADLWTWRSQAASLGGVGDRGGGLTAEGITQLRIAIQRNHLPEISPLNIPDAVRQRLAIYTAETGTLPGGLVNVGGNHVIFGEKGRILPLHQGLTTGYHPELWGGSGLFMPFVSANRPVIHLINIRELAAQYDITMATPTGKSRAMLQPSLPLFLRILLFSWLGALACLLSFGSRHRWWSRGPII